jgi:hypothetical protein
MPLLMNFLASYTIDLSGFSAPISRIGSASWRSSGQRPCIPGCRQSAKRRPHFDCMLCHHANLNRIGSGLDGW